MFTAPLPAVYVHFENAITAGRLPAAISALPDVPPLKTAAGRTAAPVHHPAAPRIDHDDPHSPEAAPKAPLDVLGPLVGPDSEVAEHSRHVTRLTVGATIGTGQRIDHCFVSAALASRVKAACIDVDATGSDHQPLWVEMDL